MSTTPPVVGSPSELERLRLQILVWEKFLHQFGCDLRVAEPGVVTGFDVATQTVTVQLLLAEKIRQAAGGVDNVPIPPIFHLPIVFPRGGGWTLTMPIAVGDECLVVFGDMCIDDWWQSGYGSPSKPTIANQIGPRRHDLRDGFALFGISNQKRLIEDYSTTSCQLRSDDGTVAIDLAPAQVTVTADVIKLLGALTLDGILSPTTGPPTETLPVTIGGVTKYLCFRDAP